MAVRPSGASGRAGGTAALVTGIRGAACGVRRTGGAGLSGRWRAGTASGPGSPGGWGPWYPPGPTAPHPGPQSWACRSRG